jgi:hypothetical protein
VELRFLATESRLPEPLRAWIEQLLEPEITRLFDVFPEDQIDVRLSASKGRVRRRPVIVVNGGPVEMVDT